MPPTTLRLTQRQLDDIVAQARANPGIEVCGLLGGQGAEVKRVYAVPNTSPTPAARFLMDDQSFVTAYFDIEDRGWDLVAIYHSHPAGARTDPSPTDVADAGYPEALNLIVTFGVDGEPVVRVFQIDDGSVREIELEIVSA
jgi:proteasome lid subunit RPN8/RPN11